MTLPDPSTVDTDEQGFLADLETCLKSPTERLAAAQLFLESVLNQDYSPEMPASSTLMSRIASHSIFTIILRSLLLDTDNLLFPVLLRCFLAILPYAPQAITPHVPLIMIILGRAASWRDRPFADETHKEGVTRTPKPNETFGWEIAVPSAPTTIPESLQPANITQLLFVAVYSAWPSNVLAFVRDPVSYITGKKIEPVYNVPWEEVWEPGMLASRSGPLLRNFHLHPWLVYFTSSSELADEKRWEKVDPPEFITRSHMLAHSELLSGDKYDLLEGVPSEEVEVIAPTPPELSTDVAQLQRDVQLLRLEAKFANRVRKQYLYHIGRLHRHTLRFNSDEAEIHNFVNRLKDQNKTIEGLTKELAQQRADATQAQNKHVKWQEQLREKLATYREERKTWQNEAARIKGDLSEAVMALQKQKDDIATIKNERFKLQNQLMEIEPKIRHIEDYEVRMKQLTDSQKLWDDDVRRLKEAELEVESWRGRCYKVETMLRACDKERDEQAQKISALERELAAVQPVAPPPRPKSPPDMDFYITIAENAKKRVEALERENLDLRVQLEKLARLETERKIGGENMMNYLL